MTKDEWMVPEDHALLAIEPTGLSQWSEWLVAWGEARRLHQFLGLLHCGFAVPAIPGPFWGYPNHYWQWRELVEAERVCFYLNLADMHNTGGYSFLTEKEEAARTQALSHRDGTIPFDQLGEMRAELARKAFAMLSQHFFKDSNSRTNPDTDQSPSWAGVTEVALEKLLWFFRVNPDGRMPNLGRSDDGETVHDRWARQFVISLCSLGWSGRLKYRHQNDAQALLVEARPRFLELLLGMGQANLLLDREAFPFDEPCWQRLEELALRPRYIQPPLGGGMERAPVSVEEALAHDSEAAQVLILRRIMQTERERFIALRDAAIQELAAQRRQQELQGS